MLIATCKILANKYIIEKFTAWNEGCLVGVDDAGEHSFQTLTKHFGDTFIDDITTRNGSKLRGFLWMLNFWYNGEFGFTK